MKGRQIILDHIGGREAAALLVDGQLDDLLIDSHDAPRPGTIYRAVADRPVKGQGGMFLKTPDGMAFLRQVKGMAPGDVLLVQVTGLAEPGKAIPVTHKVLFKSRYAIVTPGAPGVNVSRSIRDDDRRDALLGVAHEVAEAPEAGIILRSACAEADDADVAEDIAAMLDLAEQVMGDADGPAEKLIDGDGPHVSAWRDWSEPAEVVTEAGSFDTHGVLDALEDALGARVPLGGGADMYVEPTRALVAVDVNTGKDISPAAGTKANFAVAKALPRALRVRGLGGQIVLDLAPMPKKDRRGFESALRAAFKRDTIDTTLVGWTQLGHYELQRKNARAALSEVLK
ncbi:MAG: ribonuclease E/G [Shimia sp.]|uniref:ribonuclease E/G n=1 Tax=Shimia sp. TaxID=1954381 RepID=UPI001B2832C4|nr:ribonuclease E/G [Shimia sp.]MBO6896745.1 ribonuclease E/G [Shimia sp.]